MSDVKPYKIIIEWKSQEDFYFSCDYAPPDVEKNRNNPSVGEKNVSLHGPGYGQCSQKASKRAYFFSLVSCRSRLQPPQSAL